jgi:hypothetical protein
MIKRVGSTGIWAWGMEQKARRLEMRASYTLKLDFWHDHIFFNL